jgi:hypothetical protein
MDSSARNKYEHGTEGAEAGAPRAGASADSHYARRWLILLVVIVAQVTILRTRR